MPAQKGADAPVDLEAEIEAMAEQVKINAGPADVIAAARRVDADERPTQTDAKRVTEAERIMAADAETALVAGFMEAWRVAGCPPVGRGDLNALHAIQTVAGHFAQRGREHNDITKARAA